MTRSILITGCSTGIGYMAALALKQRGYHVIASCRHIDDVKRLQQEGVTCIQLDLSDEQSIHQGVKAALELSNHQLYALFNNGAYGQPGALEDLSTAALRAQFETNFFGWHTLTTLLLPHFRQQGHGRIIQNSSILGFAAMKYRGAYNASKFAIEGWTDTLRLELQASNIHISLLEPGPINTEFRANALTAFKRWINIEHSLHHQAYQTQLARLENAQSNHPFALSAEACLAPILHALEAKHPKLRYRVTVPTKVFALLKRLLPGRVLDKLLSKAA
ncbi:SDR family oxidoreductase [Vibrio sp. V31_P5A7T61]|uniref:SDR family oxidoreductase n=1 Tax=unclassified Vibrio TaxID=2614977 RepID=UPI001372CD7C|nr:MULTISPECIES: SDR family oxidoreductase [unclassified Vibrio]NAW62582.1 SDR family oxidoreductase [Vibrio sp. V31_P5A7T61]NAX01756.1 SDR family oxidoreductase [Vibrio sp. V34_P3A8T189]NAX07007.1 SDR family oxidoreductase [Vibrio sp. V40_P2S30T141]NAX62534.1 SDR family oxidoreductase [Vibrio sp. V32_P6A28T40]